MRAWRAVLVDCQPARVQLSTYCTPRVHNLHGLAWNSEDKLGFSAVLPAAMLDEAVLCEDAMIVQYVRDLKVLSNEN